MGGWMGRIEDMWRMDGGWQEEVRTEGGQRSCEWLDGSAKSGEESRKRILRSRIESRGKRE